MATTALIVGGLAAAGAAASAGGQAYAAHQAGRRQAPRTTQVPPPAYQTALQRYYASILARNATRQPMSFGQWEAGGGMTPALQLQDPGMTPQEAMNLGIVGPRGQQIPFVDPSQQTLTPEQQLYLGYQRAQQGLHGPLVRAYNINQRIGRLEDRPQTAHRQALEERLRARRGRLLDTGPPPSAFTGRLY